MRFLFLILFSLISLKAQTVVSIDTLPEVAAGNTNVLLYVLQLTPLSQRKLTPSVTNLSQVSGKSILTVDAINSQALFEDILFTLPAGGVVGSVINSGASQVGFTPVYVDLTGTNITPGLALYQTSTNASFIGTVLATNLVTIGSGSITTNYARALPKLLSVASGTSTAPDTNQTVLSKFSRIMEMSATGISGDGSDFAGAVSGISIGTVNNEVQTIGVHGVAQSSSTSVATSGADDAAGGYFVGRIRGAGTGAGIGLFANGRRDTATAKAVGFELSVDNNTTTPENYIDDTSLPATRAAWIHATGQTNSAVGILFGNPFGPNFDMGLVFNGQIADGQTGSVRTASIRDGGAALSSYQILGTHTQAIGIGVGAGHVSIGRTNLAPIFSTSLLDVYKNGDADPLVTFSGQGTNDNISATLRNGAGNVRWFMRGDSEVFTGLARGDGGMVISVTNKAFQIGGSGNTSVISVMNSGSGQFGAFNTTPVAQQDTDIATALSNYGWVASSAINTPKAGSVLTIWPRTNNTFSSIWIVAPTALEHLGAADYPATIVVNGGTVTNSVTAIDTDEPGDSVAASNAGTNAVAGFRMGATAMVFGTATKRLHMRFQIPSVLSTDADGYELTVGFQDQASDARAFDGAYFFYTHGENSGNIIGATSTNATRTVATGGGSVAAVAGTWMDGFIEANATRARFWLSSDGGATVTYIGESTSNIPATTARAFGISPTIRKIGGSVGTTSILFYVGRMAFYPR